MADVTIIIVHRMFIASLDNSICSTSSTACFLPCNKFTATVKHGLITESASQQFFFRFISTSTI